MPIHIVNYARSESNTTSLEQSLGEAAKTLEHRYPHAQEVEFFIVIDDKDNPFNLQTPAHVHICVEPKGQRFRYLNELKRREVLFVPREPPECPSRTTTTLSGIFEGVYKRLSRA